MKRSVQYGLYAGFCAIAFFVYRLTFGSFLFFDDVINLGGNPCVATNYSGFLWAHSRWVVSLWNYFTLSSSGYFPESFRIQNFVVHLLISGMLLHLFNVVFEQMPKDSWLFKRGPSISLIAAGLFLLHPVQSQTALHVLHMRLEGFMVLCGLIVCFLMIKSILSSDSLQKNGWFFASLVFSVVAVGSKESIIVVPVLIFLIDWFFIARGSLAEMYKRILMYGIFCMVFYGAFFALHSNINFWKLVSGDLSVFSRSGYLLTESYDIPMSSYGYFLTQIPLFFHYLFIFIYPSNLCIDYNIPLILHATHPAVLLGLCGLVVVAIGVAVAWYFERSNLVSFGVAWFFVALLPRTTFVPSSDLVGDYKTFFASVGMMILLSGVFVWFFDLLIDRVTFFRSQWGFGFLAGCCLWFFVMLVGVTSAQCDLWCDPVAFWKYVRVHTPLRAAHAYHLGLAFADANKPREALDSYYESVQLDAHYAEPLVKLGECYQKNGETARALSYYSRAENCKSQPLAQLHNNKGLLFFEQDDFMAAEEQFSKALKIKPVFSECLFNYANLLKKTGRFVESYAAINECIRCSPHNDNLQVALLKARLAFEIRDFKEVVAMLEPCIDKTEDIALHFMLASAYYSLENYKKAVDLFEKVYNKRPDNLDVCYNYAQALMRTERYSSAIVYFKQCSLSDKYPFAPLHAAACLYRNGNHAAAHSLVTSLDQQSILSEPVRAELSLLKRDMHLVT